MWLVSVEYFNKVGSGIGLDLPAVAVLCFFLLGLEGGVAWEYGWYLGLLKVQTPVPSLGAAVMADASLG